MEASSDSKIFHDSSVRDFCERLKVWINQCNSRFFYFGSYVYDINGNLYEGYDTDNWLDKNNTSLSKNEQAYIDIIRRKFDSTDFMSSISITQIIQQQYLNKQDQILHLSYDSVSGNNIFELIPVDIDKCCPLLSTIEKEINDTKLEDEELDIRNDIIKSFDIHFELIRQSCTHLYFFPTIFRFLNSTKVINVSTFISPIKLSQDTVYYIQGGLTYCSERLISDTIQDLSNQAKDKAIKSAKAAIMSRNMSHNIGSHVMSYLKQHLSSVKDIVSDGLLSNLINGEDKLFETHKSTIEDTTLPFLMGLGHFISYLQERQDFIATIATDYIPYFGNVNFKDSIYDELNPDKRAIRHSDRKNGLTDNILLGNIARSDGLGRRTTPTQLASGNTSLNDIVLKYKTKFNGDPVVELDDNGRVLATLNEDAAKELDDMRGKDLSLPGGIVGRQAFFSIMENIIRNAAKHGSWRDNLELTFDFFSCQREDLERLEAFNNDNVDENSLTLKEVLTNYYLNAVDAKDLYFVTITDNCSVVTNNNGRLSWETLGKLRSALMSKYITDSGEMDETSKGLKEMRISAAWMRAVHDEAECFEPYIAKAKPVYLENDKPKKYGKIWKANNDNEKKAPLIYTRISAKRSRRGLTASNLQYIICVQIPRKVALVLKDDESLPIVKTNLERINWRAYSKNEFLQERNKSFEFILIDDKDCENPEELYNEVRCFSTARTFRLSEIRGLNRDAFLQNIKASHYTGKEDLELFYKELSKYKDERIVVDDKIVNERNKEEDRDMRIDVRDGYNGKDSVYIYRRHHEADVEFTSFMDSGLSALFVEGISGNNSSDRLIRNEKLNTTWFYRHLHAMKQQIAIFDERLFQKMTGLEEKDLIDKENEDLKRCKDNTALAFLQKGVFPFTLVENRKNCYKLKGIIFDGVVPRPRMEIETIKEDSQSPIRRYYCLCGTLATLSFQDGELRIDPTDGSGYMNNHFDYITIHQGLLDKLYKSFNIKKEDINAKETITKGLFEKYSNQNELSNQFLPGMIVHSGRSKPNKEEMPQRFPFIQYAALDHAVMDCKYSLVELLDFARYEE